MSIFPFCVCIFLAAVCSFMAGVYANDKHAGLAVFFGLLLIILLAGEIMNCINKH